MNDIVIVGAGGHAGECLWAAEEMGKWNVLGCVVYDPSKFPPELYGYPVLGTLETFAKATPAPIAFCCGIGDNIIREQEVNATLAAGWSPVALIHRSAVVAKNAVIGQGSYLAPHSLVSANARVGQHVIINYSATVGHDSQIGAYAQICPGVRVSGRCTVGRSVFIGSNAVLAPGTVVGDGAVIGACSFVSGVVPAGSRIGGAPAKALVRKTAVA